MKTEITKWDLWDSFQNWAKMNDDRLYEDFLRMQASANGDNVCYEDYIGARWQRNDL